MKNMKNLYALLVLFSYPITITIMTILRNISTRAFYSEDTSIKLITLSIIVFSIIKYKESSTKQNQDIPLWCIQKKYQPKLIKEKREAKQIKNNHKFCLFIVRYNYRKLQMRIGECCISKLEKVAKHSLKTLRNGVAPEWQPPSMSFPMKRSIADISKKH